MVFDNPGSATTSASFPLAGTYVLQLTADDGTLQSSDSVTITVSETPVIVEPTSATLDVHIEASSDDAEESTSGRIRLNSQDLELVSDASSNTLATVGLRFKAVSVPPGATITSAYIQFRADETDSGPALLTIQGEASNDAVTFSRSRGNISSRPRTESTVLWSPLPWTVVGATGENQRTSDIAPVVQEVVNTSGWNSGNSLAIIISGSGQRTAESYDESSSASPLLHVEYEVGN